MISMTSRPGAAAFFSAVDREVSPTEPDFGVLLWRRLLARPDGAAAHELTSCARRGHCRAAEAFASGWA
jgi:hypothetical protein